MTNSTCGYADVTAELRRRRPGFWEEAPQGQGGLVEPSHQDSDPSPAKSADQVQTGGPPLPSLARESH
jgi:hypothetical protein